MKLRPLAEMKPTGEAWFGQIPAAWDFKRLKYLAQFKSGEGITSDEIAEAGEYPVYGGNGLRGYTNRYTHEGDFVLIGRQGALCGNINYAGGRFWASEHAIVATLRSEHSVVWFGELLRTLNLNRLSQSAAQPGLAVERIQNIFAPVPPLAEQRRIASFLDAKLGRLDELTRKKERQLALLAEKRQALISHAVTRGLDPNAPTQPSGLPWLGNIPAGAAPKRLKHLLTKVEQGWSPQCENRIAADGEWGVLKVGCVNGTEFDETENKALPSFETPLPELEIKPGDILVSRANTTELLGSAALVKKIRPRLLLCDKLFRLTAREQVDRRFLTYSLASGSVRYQFERDATGASSSMKNIGQDTLRNSFVVEFAPKQQTEIADFLDNETSHLDRARQRITDQLAKLGEYRQALITAAVTGQVAIPKVRPTKRRRA